MSDSNLRIGFQGELGAFSEMAARAHFGEDVDVAPQPNFSELFESVVQGACTHAMAPIENTLMGSIHENYDLLLKHDLQIVGELKLRIVHNLIVNCGVRLEDVRHIYSQPPALAQCTEFIKSLEQAEAVVAHDTAGAVKNLKEQGARDAAAIASAQAAVDYDLEILKSEIENNHQNFTRFLVMAREGVQPDDPAKTSIVFSTKGGAGALYRSLSAFALRDVNLIKIESRPLDGRPWEYVFYLDFEGHMGDQNCQRAIEHLKETAAFVKILGSYTQGDAVEGRPRPRRTQA